MSPSNTPDSDSKPGPKFYAALACYGCIALLAGVTLDGNFRLFVWVFLAALAVRTYLALVRKP